MAEQTLRLFKTVYRYVYEPGAISDPNGYHEFRHNFVAVDAARVIKYLEKDHKSSSGNSKLQVLSVKAAAEIWEVLK